MLGSTGEGSGAAAGGVDPALEAAPSSSRPSALTGAAALRPDTPWTVGAWIPAFLIALADEAEDGLQLLADMERVWFAARQAVSGGRSNSRAGPAIDLMAATPLVSATSLASGLGMAVKNATALLDRFCREGIAIEVMHRSKRRLWSYLEVV